MAQPTTRRLQASINGDGGSADATASVTVNPHPAVQVPTNTMSAEEEFKANVQDISFTKYLDKSTTSFIKALVTGAHIGTATLFVSKAGGKQEDYFTIKLTSAMVTSYSTGGSGGEDMLTENISISFAKFDVEYFAQNDKGVVASAGTVGYSVEEVAAS